MSNKIRLKKYLFLTLGFIMAVAISFIGVSAVLDSNKNSAVTCLSYYTDDGNYINSNKGGNVVLTNTNFFDNGVDIGEEVSISANANAGYTFVGFYSSEDFNKDSFITNSNPYKLTVEENTQIYANFAKNYDITLEVKDEENNPKSTIVKTCYFGQELNVKDVIAENLGETTAKDYSNSTPTITEDTTGLEVSQNTIKVGAGATTLSISPSEPSSVGYNMLVEVYYTDNGTDFTNSVAGGYTSNNTNSASYYVFDSVGVSCTANSGYTFVGWYKEANLGSYTIKQKFNIAYAYNDKAAKQNPNSQWQFITAFFAKKSTVRCFNYAESTSNSYTITVVRDNATNDTYTCNGAATIGNKDIVIHVGAYLTFSETVKISGQTTNYTSYTLSSGGATIDYSFVYAPKYTITLNDNQGSGGDSTIYILYKQGIYSNSTCTTSKSYVKIPTRSGYTFNGYYTARTGGSMRINSGGGSISNSAFSADTTIYAQWTVGQVNVTLDQRGGTGGTTSISPTYGSSMPAITLPTRTGYTFQGYWSLDSNGVFFAKYYDTNGSSASNWDLTGSNIYLYAKWTEIICTITLNQQGGGNETYIYQKYNIGYYENIYCNLGSEKTGITSRPTKSGNVFYGYYTNVNGTGDCIINSSGSIVASNIKFTSSTATIYAYWKDSSNSVRIYFNNNMTTNPYGYNDDGGVGSLESIFNIPILGSQNYMDVALGTTFQFTLNSNFQYGPNFYKPQCVVINDEPYNVTSNNTISFQVTKETYIKSFYYRSDYLWRWFIFLGNGGVNPSDSNHNYLSIEGTNSLTLPDNTLQKSGYSGYYWGNAPTSPSLTAFQGNDVEGWPMFSYVQWNLVEWRLTYNLNNGVVTGTNPSSYNIYSNDITLINPTRAGYTFVGWTSYIMNNPSLNITVPTLTVTITKGSTYWGEFTANWEANPVKITFDPTGGTISNGKTIIRELDTGFSSVSFEATGSTVTFTSTTTTISYQNYYYFYLNGYSTANRSNVFATIDSSMGMSHTDILEFNTEIQQFNEISQLKPRAPSWLKFECNSYSDNVYLNNIKLYEVSMNLSTNFILSLSNAAVDNIRVPVRQGYSFNGYFSATSGGTKYYNADGTPTSASGFTLSGDITLYAQWTIQSYTPTIKVYLDGVEKTNATEIANIATYVIPASMTNGQTYTNLSVTFKNQYTHDTAENRGLPKINFAGGGNFTSFELTSGKTYTISSIPCSGQPLVNIYAKLDTKILTINTPTNGTLTVKRSGTTLTSPSNIYIGESLAITITPNAGYLFNSLTIVNNGVTEAITTATTSKTITVNGNISISATFKAKTFTLSWSVTNGNMSDCTNNGTSIGTGTTSISGQTNSGTLGINYGQTLKFSFTSIVGYSLPASVTINGTAITITRTNSNRNGETANFAVPNLTNGATISFSLSATANTNTAYKVEHYVMNTSGSYPSTATSTDNLTGTTDTPITLADKKKSTLLATNGIEYLNGKIGSTVATTTTISGDGTRVIKLYYNRLQKTVTISKTNCSISVTRESDSTTVANNGTVYYEDRLAISFSCGANYTMITKTINGSAFSALTYDVPASSIAIVGVASMIVPTGVTFTFDDSNPSDKKAYINGFSTNSTSIVLPNTVSKSGSAGVAGLDYKVVGISANAFKNRTTLQSVTLNANIKSIGESAFENCTALTTIDLTNATTISSKAFYKCTNLGQIKIGTDATISELAFGEAFKPKAKTVYINDTSILADIVKSNWYATNGNDYGNLLAGATIIYVPKNATVSSAISQNHTKTTSGNFDIYTLNT